MEDGPEEAAPPMPLAGPELLHSADLELLSLLAQGLPVESMARRSGLSERTVRRRFRAICDRLGVQTPVEAAVWAARRGLV